MGKVPWALWLIVEELAKWLKNQQLQSLFLDGASKGNPGRSSVGGIILDPSGQKITSYSWGLGTCTNNYAEACGLWQGIQILKILHIQKHVVIGDSHLIISKLNHSLDTPRDDLIDTQGILQERPHFTHLNFYHVIREHNSYFERLANVGADL